MIHRRKLQAMEFLKFTAGFLALLLAAAVLGPVYWWVMTRMMELLGLI